MTGRADDANGRLPHLIRDGDIDPPLFLPVLGSVLAVIADRPWRALCQDATSLSNALRDARGLLKLDVAVVDGVDALYESGGATIAWDDAVARRMVSRPWASALPARVDPRVAERGFGAVIEAVRRLHAVSDAPLGLALPGPGELLVALRGGAIEALGSSELEDGLDLAMQLLVAAVRAAGEARCDLLVLSEGALVETLQGEPALAVDAWMPAQNLAAHYGMHTVLAPTVSVARPEDITSVALLPSWGFALPAGALAPARTESAVIGRGVPADAFPAVSLRDSPGAFLTTLAPLHREVPLSVIETLRSALDS